MLRNGVQRPKSYLRPGSLLAGFTALAILCALTIFCLTYTSHTSSRVMAHVVFRQYHLDNETDKYIVHQKSPRGELMPLSIDNFLEGLAQSGSALRAELTRTLQMSRFGAFYWEMPRISAHTRERGAEFVLVDAPGFGKMKGDYGPFSGKLDGAAGRPVCVAFDNLSGDARLVAPARAPAVCVDTYAHLAAFVRNAPAEQVDDLWRAVGRTARSVAEARARDRWISTAGDGVAWLHVRFDTRPKYYKHAPYRETGP